MFVCGAAHAHVAAYLAAPVALTRDPQPTSCPYTNAPVVPSALSPFLQNTGMDSQTLVDDLSPKKNTVLKVSECRGRGFTGTHQRFVALSPPPL